MWSFVVESRPIDVAPLNHIEGILRPDGFNWWIANGSTEETDVPKSWTGCEVRVRYKYYQSERHMLNVALVREPFKDALNVVVEAIAEPNRELRAPAVAVAKTLKDKIHAWAQVTGVTTAASLLGKLDLIEHEDPAAVSCEMELQLRALETLEIIEGERVSA